MSQEKFTMIPYPEIPHNLSREDRSEWLRVAGEVATHDANLILQGGMNAIPQQVHSWKPDIEPFRGEITNVMVEHAKPTR